MVCVGGGGVDVRMLVAMDVGEGVMLVMRWRRWWWWGGGGEVVVAVGCGWDGWWWEGGGKVVGVCAVVMWWWWCVRGCVWCVCVSMVRGVMCKMCVCGFFCERVGGLFVGCWGMRTAGLFATRMLL